MDDWMNDWMNESVLHWVSDSDASESLYESISERPTEKMGKVCKFSKWKSDTLNEWTS